MKTTRALLTVTAALALGGAELMAQDFGRGRGPGVRSEAGVERVMRLQDELELSAEQMDQLDAARAEGVAFRNSAASRLAEVHSRYDAGLIRQSELMAALEDERDAAQGFAEQQRANLDGLLTDDQRASFEELRRKRGDRPGRGGRGGRGMRSGQRDGGGQGMRNGRRNGGGAGIGGGWRGPRDGRGDRGRRGARVDARLQFGAR